MTTGVFIYNLLLYGTPNVFCGLAPASNGTEAPIRNAAGKWFLYVFDFNTQNSYYINTKGERVDKPFNN
jgi:hypothetical protein